MKAKEITYKGETVKVPDLARMYGMTPGQLYTRLAAGWDIEKALTAPVRMQKAPVFEYRGGYYTAVEIAAMHGNLSPSSVRQRLEKGMTVEEILATPNTRPKLKTAITVKKQVETIPLKYVPKKKIDTTQCRTCQYSDVYMHCCYALVEKKCRMFISPPSPHCTVYVKGKSLVRAAALKRQGLGREAM